MVANQLHSSRKILFRVERKNGRKDDDDWMFFSHPVVPWNAVRNRDNFKQIMCNGLAEK